MESEATVVTERVDTVAGAKPYPDNGFVDAAGRLTAAGSAAVAAFVAAYPVPIKALYGCKQSVMKATYWKVVAMIRAGTLDPEEVDAEIRLSVTKGVRRYDPVKAAERKASVTTYLVNWVLQGAQRAIDRVTRDARIAAVRIGSRTDDGPCLTDVPDRGPDGRDDIDGPFGALQTYVDQLPADRRKLVYERFGEGKSARLIGEAEGKSKACVQQNTERTLAEIRGRAVSSGLCL